MNKNDVNKIKAKYTYVPDIVMTFLLAGCAAFFFCMATHGLNLPDESFYASIPYRFSLGDAPFIDDWHVSQLSAVLTLLPVKLFMFVTGSTDGIILYLRCVYAVCQLAVSVFAYKKTRRFGWSAVIGVFLFCAYVPLDIATMSYYTMSIMALEVCGVILFLGEKTPGTFSLVFCGIVFACGVLAEPLLFFVYFFYSVLALVRLLCIKRGKPFMQGFSFILDVNIWLKIFIGVIGSFLLFIVFLLSRATVSEIIAAAPNMFLDQEYNFSSGGNIMDFDNLKYFAEAYSPAGIVILFAAVLLPFLDRGKKHGRETVLFSMFAVVAVSIYAAVRDVLFNGGSLIYVCRLFPLLIPAAVCFAVSEKKDYRTAAFILFSAGASVCVDIASDFSFFYCFSSAALPCCILTGECIKTLVSDADKNISRNNRTRSVQNIGIKKEKKSKRILGFASPVTAVFLLVFSCVCLAASSKQFFMENTIVTDYGYSEFNDTGRAVLARGPYKGVVTVNETAEKYYMILNDLNYIAEHSERPVYIMGRYAWMYLYIGRDIPSFSAWYQETEDFSRQLLYWELHPDRVPDYFYIPKVHPYLLIDADYEDYLKKKTDFLNENFGPLRVTETEAGFIVTGT